MSRCLPAGSRLHGSGDPGIPTPPNPGKLPPPKLPPGPDRDEVPEAPDTGPAGPRSPDPDPPFDEPPDPSSVPDRLPGHPSDPGVRR